MRVESWCLAGSDYPLPSSVPVDEDEGVFPDDIHVSPPLPCFILCSGSKREHVHEAEREYRAGLGTPPVVPEVVDDCLLRVRYRDDELFLDGGRKPPRPDQR